MALRAPAGWRACSSRTSVGRSFRMLGVPAEPLRSRSSGRLPNAAIAGGVDALKTVSAENLSPQEIARLLARPRIDFSSILKTVCVLPCACGGVFACVLQCTMQLEYIIGETAARGLWRLARSGTALWRLLLAASAAAPLFRCSTCTPREHCVAVLTAAAAAPPPSLTHACCPPLSRSSPSLQRCASRAMRRSNASPPSLTASSLTRSACRSR